MSPDCPNLLDSVGARCYPSQSVSDTRSRLLALKGVLAVGNPAHIAKVKEVAEATKKKLDDMSSTIADPAQWREALKEMLNENQEEWKAWCDSLPDKLDVSGADFSGVTLIGTDFMWANVAGANFAR